ILEPDPESECAGGNQEGAKNQSQEGGTYQGVANGNQTGEQVQNTAQAPEQKAAPAFGTPCMSQMQHAAYAHQDADIHHAGNRGTNHVDQGDQTQNDQGNAQTDKPSRFQGQLT